MDITILKSDIKTWERAFKAKHSREPNVEDIKCRPDIAVKYKLYKTLSKELSTFSKRKAMTGAESPSTPPRNEVALPGASSIIPKSRATHGNSDPFSPNPFSPIKRVKSPGDSSSVAINSLVHSQFLYNQPTTPEFSTKHQPLSNPFEIFGGLSSPTPPGPNKNEGSTVKRARKRLRGDAASPTPIRTDKKRRTKLVSDSSSQAAFSSGSRVRSGSHELESADEADASYVDESPVKSTSYGKSFKLLFEESPSQLSSAQLRSERYADGSTLGASGQITGQLVSGNGFPPSLRSMQGLMPSALSSGSRQTRQPTTSIRDLRSSMSYTRKRSSSDAEPVDEYDPQAEDKLLPPSPVSAPPLLPRIPKTGKGKKTSMLSRKKLKVSPNDEQISSEDEQIDAQIFETEMELRGGSEAYDLSSDDLELSGHRSKRFDHTQESEAPEVKVVEVDLPDNLRSVLHISSSHSREREERALVDSLLFGETSPNRYGEVWGLGEVELPASVTDDEDDWVGEGVPWEAAEL